MAKLKETSGSSKKENIKMVTGKISKLKKLPELAAKKKLQDKIHPLPKGTRNVPNVKKLGMNTPVSKNPIITSTPFNSETNEPNGKKLPFRMPLSPILCNSKATTPKLSLKSSCQSKKESLNDGKGVASKASNPTILNENRFGTRRRSFGVRKITPAPQNNIAIEKPMRNARVSLRKLDYSSIKDLSSLSSDSLGKTHVNKKSNDTIFSDSSDMEQSKKTSQQKAENTLIKNLRSDWSSTTFGDENSILRSSKTQLVRHNKCSRLRLKTANENDKSSSNKSKKQQPNETLVRTLESSNVARKSQVEVAKKNDSITEIKTKIEPRKNGKRRLTTLIELSVEDKTVQSGTQKEISMDTIEEVYSSSEEFQSDDETINKGRSKRAPTWKELFNKTKELSPKSEKVISKSAYVKLKRIRSESNHEPFSSSDVNSKEPNNGSKEMINQKKREVETEGVARRISIRKIRAASLRLNKQKENPLEIGEVNSISSSDENHQQSNLINPRKNSIKKDDSNDLKQNEKNNEREKKREVDKAEVSNKVQALDQPRRSLRINIRKSKAAILSPTKQNEITSAKAIENNENTNEKENERENKAFEVARSKKTKTQNVGEQKNNFEGEIRTDVPLVDIRVDCTANDSIDDGENTEVLPLQEKSTSIEKPESPVLNKETETTKKCDKTIPIKFFHSRLENTLSSTKAPENMKRRRSSKRKKQESVYEFLSQSSSDSNKPIDDVIQRMIKTGKVVVAKHKKGTGRMTVPKNRPAKAKKKIINKVDKIQVKNIKTSTETEKKQVPQEPKTQGNYDNLHVDEDDFHFDEGGGVFDDRGSDFEIPENGQFRDQRGFSNLARSAMINQAGRIQKPLQRKPIKDRKKLLEMAMKFVNQSTPVRIASPQQQQTSETPIEIRSPPSLADRSPLSLGNRSQMSWGSRSPISTENKSTMPWRPDDDKLPSAFYLGRNSDNLPSFSSDHIPMTPTKNKSKSMSSFSSNDSNGENQAPSGAKIITNEATLQVLANTRKGLSHRSPLKTLNIIEVVNLPPLALHSYGKQKENKENPSKKETNLPAPLSPLKSARNLFENISNHSLNSSKSDVSNDNIKSTTIETKSQSRRSAGSDESQISKKSSGTDDSNNNLSHLFGFEDLIDEETNITVDKTILPNKENLKKGLLRLKKLLPNKPVIVPRSETNRVQPVFDDVRPVQKSIKQMLCSTLIDPNPKHVNIANQGLNESEDLSNLFKDPDPETTFDESKPRRTYNRPPKRKRKVVSNFTMFLESDVSDEEPEEEVRPVKIYKAKPKKQQKVETELNKFVNEFNEMCKEVSQYELIVE